MPKHTISAATMVTWEIRIPLSTAAKTELLLIDPITGSARYAARSQLVTALVEQWLNSIIDSNANSLGN